jgi:lipopolysaccharide export system protein LptC
LNASQAALLGGLVITATLTGWLLWNQNSYIDPISSSAHGPDLFVHDMRLRVLDESGALQYRIRAGTMHHYPGDDRIALQEPVLEIFADQQLQWRIESEHSQLDDTGETVNLLGEVRIHRPETTDNQGVEVLTRDLVVKPDQRTADTEQKAIIESGPYTIEGVGMHADFTTNRLELHSRVRGRYDVSG